LKYRFLKDKIKIKEIILKENDVKLNEIIKIKLN